MVLRTAFSWAPSQVETPHSNGTRSPSTATPTGASTVNANKVDKPTERPPPGDISGRNSTAKPTEKAPPGDTSERNSSAEDERAAFRRLQASVAENAQVCEQYCRYFQMFSPACKLLRYRRYRVSLSGSCSLIYCLVCSFWRFPHIGIYVRKIYV